MSKVRMNSASGKTVGGLKGDRNHLRLQTGLSVELKLLALGAVVPYKFVKLVPKSVNATRY